MVSPLFYTLTVAHAVVGWEFKDWKTNMHGGYMLPEDDSDWTKPLLTSHLTVFETRTARTLCRILKCVCENLDPSCFTEAEVEECFNDLGGKCRKGKYKVPNHFDATHLEFLETVKLIVQGPEPDTFALADEVRRLYEPAPEVVALTDDEVVSDHIEPAAPPLQEESCNDGNDQLVRVEVFRATS